MFFVVGGITSLNDVIIPKLKDIFTLDYAQALLVQSAFFAAYAIVSIPAVALVRRAGYMRTAALGLLTMMAGCLLFVPASRSACSCSLCSCSPPGSPWSRSSPIR